MKPVAYLSTWVDIEGHGERRRVDLYDPTKTIGTEWLARQQNYKVTPLYESPEPPAADPGYTKASAEAIEYAREVLAAHTAQMHVSPASWRLAVESLLKVVDGGRV